MQGWVALWTPLVIKVLPNWILLIGCLEHVGVNVACIPWKVSHAEPFCQDRINETNGSFSYLSKTISDPVPCRDLQGYFWTAVFSRLYLARENQRRQIRSELRRDLGRFAVCQSGTTLSGWGWFRLMERARWDDLSEDGKNSTEVKRIESTHTHTQVWDLASVYLTRRGWRMLMLHTRSMTEQVRRLITSYNSWISDSYTCKHVVLLFYVITTSVRKAWE